LSSVNLERKKKGQIFYWYIKKGKTILLINIKNNRNIFFIFFQRPDPANYKIKTQQFSTKGDNKREQP